MTLIQKLRDADGPSRELDEAIERATKRNAIVYPAGSDCWEWSSKSDKRGRGRVSVSGKNILAHRAVWMALVGEIPDGAFLCHHCDNPKCVNPDHLYVGDHASNMRDMVNRKRSFGKTQPEKHRLNAQRVGRNNTHVRGEANPRAKLTREDVSDIRLSTAGTKFLSEKYSVNKTTIQRIRSGKAWSSLTALEMENTNDN